MTVALLLLIIAFILFVLATFSVSTKFNLVAAGLACMSLAGLLGSGLFETLH